MSDPTPNYDPLPTRLHIQRVITDRLRGVTPENGYQHDLSAAVFRGRQYFGSQDPLPMVVLLQAPQQDEPGAANASSSRYRRSMNLLIQGFAVDDPEHPTDPAEMLLAEVTQRLAGIPEEIARAPEMSWHRVDQLEIGPGICRPPDQEVSAVAYFWLQAKVWYVEDSRSPYV